MESFQKNSAVSCGFDAADALAKATASAGAEGDDGLAGPVVTFHKGENSHGNIVPPVGIANKDGVIIIHVFHLRGQSRAGVFFLLLLGLIHYRIIIIGVGHLCFNGKQIAAGFGLNHVG